MINNSDIVLSDWKEISFNDSINFNALINWAKDKKIISENILKKIDNFRKMRINF